MSKEDFNRFDLESQICNCWQIIDDLKEDGGEYENALSVIYGKRFEKLWEIFETMVHEGKI